MKKTIAAAPSGTPPPPQENWLDLETIASVRLSSEDPEHPIEAALRLDPPATGWRASQPGQQEIHLHFDPPQSLHHIHLQFVVAEDRTQEFEVAWSRDGGTTLHSLRRQQFNFSAAGATTEEEDYRVDLRDVTDLRLRITPDISGGRSHATLHRLRVR